MLWWNKEKKRKMEFIQGYVPTSKAQLIQMAMFYNNGDMQKAQEMFDFYASNLQLPDFDPVAPTFMQQVRGNFSDFYSWIKENQSDIVQGWQFIQGIIKNRGEVGMVGEVGNVGNVGSVGEVGEALPPINE